MPAVLGFLTVKGGSFSWLPTASVLGTAVGPGHTTRNAAME